MELTRRRLLYADDADGEAFIIKAAPLSQGCESKAVSLLEFLAKSAADRETHRYLIRVRSAPIFVVVSAFEIPTLDAVDDGKAGKSIHALSVADAGEEVVHMSLLS
jgi:hypothetical protein